MTDKTTSVRQTDSPGPRRPAPPSRDFGPADVLAVADMLAARQRARLSRLTSAGRLRKWGQP